LGGGINKKKNNTIYYWPFGGRAGRASRARRAGGVVEMGEAGRAGGYSNSSKVALEPACPKLESCGFIVDIYLYIYIYYVDLC